MEGGRFAALSVCVLEPRNGRLQQGDDIPPMTLIQGYLFRQLSGSVAAACGALAGIGILSQSLDQLQVIVERGQSVALMGKLTLLALPQLLTVMLPIGLFVGALIALTRLQREQELTAAFAGGLTRWQAIRPAARLALIVAGLAMLSSTVLQPWAQREARRAAHAIRTDAAALLVQEGQFVQGPGGLTIYVQQVEQNGLLKNLFIHLDNGRTVTTWSAEEARFGRVRGAPVLTMQGASMQRYGSNNVLNALTVDTWVFDLAPYVTEAERLRFKPSDLWLTELFDPSPALLRDSDGRGALAAEAHARLSAPLYALTAMAMALAAIMGGAFSRTGYGWRISKAAGAFLLVRVVGYGLAGASASAAWLNMLQYLLPLAAAAIALSLLFRDLKPRRRPAWLHGPFLRRAPA